MNAPGKKPQDRRDLSVYAIITIIGIALAVFGLLFGDQGLFRTGLLTATIGVIPGIFIQGASLIRRFEKRGRKP